MGINSWITHTNRYVFGVEVDKFIPERWFVSDERKKAMDRYFMGFGTGSRICIGKNISPMEMAKIIPQIVRHFDVELAEWVINNQWFCKQSDILVNVS